MPYRILLVDDRTPSRAALSGLLRAAHYDVDCGTDTAEATRGHDLVIVGGSHAAPGRIAAAGSASAPILAIPGGPIRRAADLFRAGVRDVLSPDVPPALLLARIRGLMRESETWQALKRHEIATAGLGLAEPSAGFEAARSIVFVGPNTGEGAGIRVPNAFVSWRPAADLLQKDDIGRPDVIVLPSSAGRAKSLLPDLRARRHTRHSGILALYGQGDPTEAIEALDRGASDVAPNDISDEEMSLRIGKLLDWKAADEKLKKVADDSIRQALTDPLTGVRNRRYADDYLEAIARESGRDRSDFTLMMVDIDRFKSVNDSYGHQAGDIVLKEVAARIRANLRAVDTVARFGGEEFLVVMPDVDRAGAVPAAERLRRAVAETTISIAPGVGLRVTVSVGVAVEEHLPPRPEPRETQVPAGVAQLLALADRALYRAKFAGRNTVRVSPRQAPGA